MTPEHLEPVPAPAVVLRTTATLRKDYPQFSITWDAETQTLTFQPKEQE